MNKYIELENLSKEIIKEYNKCVIEYNSNIKKEENRIHIFPGYKPPMTNFNKTDYVISLMGINPSIREEDRNNVEWQLETKNKDFFENDFFIESNQKLYSNNDLGLYYVPLIEKELLEKEGIKDKFTVVNNKTYVDGQYNFLTNSEYNLFNNKYPKMYWQAENYGDILKILYKDKAKEYKEIIEKLKAMLQNENMDEKYLIYTDLLYITNNNQNSIFTIIENPNYINRFVEKISSFFEQQIEYYNAKITIVANSHASKYLKNNVISKDNKKWKKITLKGDEGYEELSNIYEYKNSKKYVILTGRYFYYTTDVFSKLLFVKELKKLINNEILN